MNNLRFKIISYDKKSQSRVGEITVTHGKIKTPAFIPVGTAATVKSLTPEEIKNSKIDAFFVNTYHMSKGLPSGVWLTAKNQEKR